MDASAFQAQVLSWFERHGRKNLPWQQNVTPYRVWLSEIMLQQTQVQTVIPYFMAFTAKFPDVQSLAQAHEDEVLSLWAGLGYYARARNLHETAKRIVVLGRFPDKVDDLVKLPGIGISTAGAISSIAFNNSAPILDGNVKRVLTRYQAIPGWPGDARVARQLWEISAELTPQYRVADYTQAMMDLGATVCTRSNPDCGRCPLMADCQAYQTNSQNTYPAPRKIKQLPVKSVIFLILENNRSQILMEKRPPAGIWGGLWALPEFLNEDEALLWCEAHQIAVTAKISGDKHRHSFTHYHLEYKPLTITTPAGDHLISEAGGRLWVNKNQLTALGLPAPIKRLLQHQQQGK